jgi:hypothetical protein
MLNLGREGLRQVLVLADRAEALVLGLSCRGPTLHAWCTVLYI